MMIGLVGLTLGLLVGAYFPGFVPNELSVYVAVAILACFDSIVGGLVAKFEKSYDDRIFISGFCINARGCVYLFRQGAGHRLEHCGHRSVRFANLQQFRQDA